jgi:hypothetical protein
VVSRASYKTGYFLCKYFVTGEDDKAVFLFLAIQGVSEHEPGTKTDENL